jgi:hypothetical protein
MLTDKSRALIECEDTSLLLQKPATGNFSTTNAVAYKHTGWTVGRDMKVITYDEMLWRGRGERGAISEEHFPAFA